MPFPFPLPLPFPFPFPLPLPLPVTYCDEAEDLRLRDPLRLPPNTDDM